MSKISNKKITRIGITTALTCVIAPMTIPTQPVPFTMATFMLWVICMVLPTDEAFYSISLFVLLGALGLPVFSNYTGGFQKVVGVTAGYIWAFPFTPLFFVLGKKIFRNKYLIRAFGVFVSFAFICLLGMFWMWVWGTKLQEIPIKKFASLWSLLKIGYLPFLGSMTIKGVLASVVADKIKISKNSKEFSMKKAKDYIVLDLETTGFDPEEGHKIVEIGMLKVIDGKIVSEFQQLVDPGIEIPFRATQVHGINNSDVYGKPKFEDIADDVLSFMENLPIVGHNIIVFDNGFLYNEGIEISNDNLIDTMLRAKNVGLSPYNLQSLVINFLQMDYIEGHRALNDCKYTYHLYEKLKKDY